MRRFLFCALLITWSCSWQQAYGQDCVPPTLTYTFSGDCQIGEFFVDIDITDLGDSPSVTIITDVFGDVIDYPNVGLGVTQVGPFYEGDLLDLTIMHDSDPACDIVYTGLVPASGCPFYLACGVPPITLNYCFQDNETIFWIFEGLGDGSLLLDFLSGGISGGDTLTIYDGPDDTGTILFQYSGLPLLDLSDLTVFSSSNTMYVHLVTNGSGSCISGDVVEWSWQMACLTCAVPMVNTTVIDDCENDQFSIHLDFTSTGGNPTVDIQYTVDGAAQPNITGVGLGETVMGPYPLGTEVNITIIHADDNLCNVPLGIITDTGYCPQLVICGGEEINETYCYGNEESMFWLYEIVGDDSSVYLEFTGGTIDGADSLTIHDGADENAPVIWENPTGTFNLNGLVLIPSSGSLFISLTTDEFTSCADGGTLEWSWTVSCLNCIPPVAAFEVVQDCENFQFYVDVNLSNLGSDPELQITNNAGAPEVSVTAPGNVLIGPFVSGTPVQITLVNDANAICNVLSPVLVNDFCPTIVCGSTPIVETYCYGGNEEMMWAYSLPGTGQLRLTFNLGTIQSSTGDSLRIYDGPNDQAPLLFEHTSTTTSEFGPNGSAIEGPGLNYYAVDVTATGPDLYMELTSNGFTHCTTSSYDPMEWQVVCEGCVPPGLSYTVEPNCEYRGFNVVVDVTELNGPEGLHISEQTTGQNITATTINSYTLESFDLDSVVNIVVQDLDEGGCTYNSGPLTYTSEECVINSCGFDNYIYCYENDEERWYTYRSVGNVPVAIFFYEGHMLAGDNIVLYNGLSENANVIYNGNNSGNLTGITTSSSNPNNALTLRIRSNGEGSCDDGQATIPLRWDVGCGFVGMNEHAEGSFSIYPNPTEAILTVDLGDMTQGPVELRVLDMSGRSLFEQVISGVDGKLQTLDLGALQNGQYMIQLISNERVGTRSFQIMR